MATGVVKKWFGEKGYGFISRSDGGDVFAHCSEIVGSRERLNEGDHVIFEEAENPRNGKLCAVNIRAE